MNSLSGYLSKSSNIGLLTFEFVSIKTLGHSTESLFMISFIGYMSTDCPRISNRSHPPSFIPFCSKFSCLSGLFFLLYLSISLASLIVLFGGCQFESEILSSPCLTLSGRPSPKNISLGLTAYLHLYVRPLFWLPTNSLVGVGSFKLQIMILSS